MAAGNSADQVAKELLTDLNSPWWTLAKLHVDAVADAARAVAISKGDPARALFLLSNVAMDHADLPIKTASAVVKPVVNQIVEMQMSRLRQGLLK